MRISEDFNLTFYISVQDRVFSDKINRIIFELEGTHASENPLICNVAIVDSQTFLVDPDRYSDSFEAVLIILLQKNIKDKDSILSKGADFFLKENSTMLEIQHEIKLIREYFSYKYQSQILNNLFNKAENSIVITDNKGIIKYANQYFLDASGYSIDELIGRMPAQVKSGVHDQSFYKDLWEKITNGNGWSGIFVNKNKKGKLFYEEANITPMYNNIGNIISYLKIGRVVERERLLSNELNKEIKKAKDMIAYMLPIKYEDEKLSLKSRLKAYNYLGGDFISFDRISSSRYIVSLIDVMGHGASATMIGIKAISVFQTAIYYESLVSSVLKVNDIVLELNKDDYFITRYISGIFIEIDVEKKTISYISAGHPDFYVKCANGLYSYSSNNMILGISKNLNMITDTIDICNVEYIYLYSDGLIENSGDKGRGQSIDIESIIYKAEENKDTFLKTVLDLAIGPNEIDDDITIAHLVFKNP